MERQSFTFYLSFEKGIQHLSDKEQLLVYRAISRYSLYGEEPTLQGAAAMAWEFIQPILKKSRKGFENGCKGAEFGRLGGAPSEKMKGNQNARKHPQTNPTDTETYTDTETESFNNSNQRLESKKPTAFLPTNQIKLENKDFEKVKDMWNTHCLGLGGIVKLNSKRPSRRNRKAAITKAVNVLIDLTNNKTKEEAMTALENVFIRVANSSFLCGQNEREWKASFDWVIKENNLIKIIEGNYDNASNHTMGAILGGNFGTNRANAYKANRF